MAKKTLELPVVLHVEDEGDDRTAFIENVLPPEEYPIRVTHLNKVTEPISVGEAAAKIEANKDRYDFFVIDLAMTTDMHKDFDRWFAQQNIPTEPPENLMGGLGLIDRMIRNIGVDKDKIAILTAHTPEGGLFRDINVLSDIWWKTWIPTYYKEHGAGLRELRKTILRECGVTVDVSSGIEPFSQYRKAPHSPMKQVICVSNMPEFRRDLTFAVEQFNDGTSNQADIDNIHLAMFEDIERASEHFLAELVGRKALAIIDITNTEEDDKTLGELCLAGNLEHLYEFLETLPGVACLKKIQKVDPSATAIVVTNVLTDSSTENPNIVRSNVVRYFMRNRLARLVMDVQDFKASMLGTLWMFYNLLKK